MNAPRITLDQWNALVAVVEAGSYASASERLHRSQSTVTYTIKKLEELLGVAVFERQGRKAVLTAAGTVLYRRGKTLVDEATRLERAALDLGQGWERELRLAAEILFPTWLMLESLAAFSEERPETRLEVIESVLGGTDEALLGGQADLAIVSHVPGGFAGDPIMQVRAVCAAAPSHPLHRLGKSLTLDDLRQHRHLIVRDSGVQRTRSAGWLNEKRWTLSHKASSIRAACMGLGYAWYPEQNIRAELESGALKPLPLLEGGARYITLYLVYADRDTAGPGTRRLAEILVDRTRACGAAALPPATR